MPPLGGLPQVGLDAEQLLDVSGLIEPELHPETEGSLPGIIRDHLSERLTL